MYRVLIVDDDHLVREGLKNSVPWSCIGFESLFFASNGKEAMTLFEKYGHDLVLTDIKMPIMDGIELCKKIRQISNDTKIVIISGYSEFEYAQKAISYDVFSYLLKPIEMGAIEEILKRIKQSLDLETKQKNENLIENISEYIIFLLNSLLDRSNESSQIIRKLRKAGLVSNDMHYRILTLDYSPSENTDIDLSCVNNTIKKISKKFGSYYLVRDLQHFILFADEKKISMNRISEFYKSISQELDSVILTGGAGTQFENINEIKKYVNESSEIIKNKYYDGKGKLYFKEDSKERAYNEEESFDIARILSGIKDHDRTNTIIELNKLFAYYKDRREPEINKICIEFMQLYNEISEELIKEYPFINSLSPESVFEKIYKCDSFNEVRSLFTGYIEDFHDTIEELREFNNQQKVVENIKKYINKNFANDLSLEELSKRFYISSSYISKLFKKECGQNIKDYIKSVRMEQARDMLINSNKRVKVIAEELGYIGYRHFCTVFKNYYNVSPLQYRIVNNNLADE